MATHSCILAKIILWTEKPMAGYRPWGCKKFDMAEHVCTQKINRQDRKSQFTKCGQLLSHTVIRATNLGPLQY